jgi:hypothetical protein
MTALWDAKPCIGYKFTDVSDVFAASITLMMEVAGTSETSVNIYQTARLNNPEDINVLCFELYSLIF